MMPPTGLTLLMHAGVILLKKVSSVFNVSFCEKTYQPETTARQAATSFMIMSLVFVYVMIVITGFVSRAMTDDHATWKIIMRAMSDVDLSPKQYSDPVYGYSLAESQGPPILLLSLNNSSIQYSSPSDETPI